MKKRYASRFHLRLLKGRHIDFVRRSYAYLLGVDCTDQEWTEVKNIPSEVFVAHGRFVSNLVGYDGYLSRVLVLCFGAACEFSSLPGFLRFDQFSGGSWCRNECIAKLVFGSGVPIRNGIMHELTHALVDFISDPFLYPYAIDEGIALLADRFYGDPLFRRGPMDAGRGPGGSLLPEQTMTIREALTVDPWQFRPREGFPGDPEGNQKVCLAGVWLLLWFATLGQKHPECRWILHQLRARRVTKLGEVYMLLTECTGMDARTLEHSFRVFTRTLRLPEP